MNEIDFVYPLSSELEDRDFPSLSLAFTFAIQDLKSLWQWYRYGYEKEMEK